VKILTFDFKQENLTWLIFFLANWNFEALGQVTVKENNLIRLSYTFYSAKQN
jgi:hypothetical protein